MKKLIVNADDFGFTRGVNAGIMRAFEMGVLTSATLMANGDAFDEAAELARSNPRLGIGCHLAVVGGRPVAPAREVASLIDRDGMLPRTLTELIRMLIGGRARVEDIEREFRAQVNRVIESGITPTHLDSHKHTHIHSSVMRALSRVAIEFGIPCVRNPFERVFARQRAGIAARAKRPVYLKQYAMSAAIAPRAISFRRLARRYGLKTPDHFCGVRLTGLLDREAMRNVIESLKEGTTELMCHPGVYDAELESARTRLKRERERELEALIDPDIIRCAEEQGVKLISYREFAESYV
jgi:hopanoid biosynthesis associated protein HpnK